MKVGDLVRLSPCDYPQYQGKIGVLVRQHHVDRWFVHIKGRMHPYHVHTINLLPVDPTRCVSSLHWD
jgi:hypothetical protein